jgi:G3E family GTPase
VPVPILLVAGFLGAGKTTVVNHLLAHAEGRRIAAVVNDFGAINIDAELIAGAGDGVVSLANGCICCSLEGDLLSKVDLTDAAGRERIRAAIATVKPAAVVVDAPHGQVPSALLFPADPDRPPRDPGRRHPVADRFETHSWTSGRLVSLPRLQAAIGQLAPKLARAKGLFETMEQPGRQLLFQLAGGRATLAPLGVPAPGVPPARIVFIAEIGVLSTTEIDRIMDECLCQQIAPPPS